MKLIKPTVLSFSLLAFAGAAAYADDANKRDRQAKPAMSQSEATKPGSAASGATGQAGPSQQSQQSQQSQPSPQAQDRQSAQRGQSASAGASAQSRTEMTASRLMDAKVTDSQGKDLGEISDVVIDLQKDRVHAIVLEFGGFAGFGGKQFVLPMSELKPGKDQNRFIVNVDKQKLENAEGFAKGQWPGMNDEFLGRVGGEKASAGGAQQAQSGGQQGQKFNLVRASKMIGSEVQDKSGKPVGNVRDVVVSLNDGQLKNLVIDVKDAGQASVAAKGLSSGTGDKLVLDMSADQVRAQAKKSDRRAQGDASGTGAQPGGAAAGATGNRDTQKK